LKGAGRPRQEGVRDDVGDRRRRGGDAGGA